MKHKTITFITQGCRLNKAETAAIKQSMLANSFKIVNLIEKPDIIVINTCTVTEKVDIDTRRLINRIKRTIPKSKIALIGCQSQILKDQLFKIYDIDWVIGNNDKMNLAQIILDSEKSSQCQIISDIKQDIFIQSHNSIDNQLTRANLKIQEGCNNFCSYCVVPYARGPARSREFNDIIREAKELALHGYKEIVITGINLTTYSSQEDNLINLLFSLAEIKDLKRIRLSSIEPEPLLKKLIHTIKEVPKICPFLHIPLQSGCDSILKQMKRKYNCQEFESFLKLAIDLIPGICVGTDVIVGFPGENEKEFEQTVELIKKLPLSYLHVFSYSDRKPALSSSFSNKIPKEIIKNRSSILQKISHEKRVRYMRQYLDQTKNVLFEEKKNGFWSGLTENFIRVKVKSEQNLKNKILPTLLTNTQNNAMIGII